MKRLRKPILALILATLVIASGFAPSYAEVSHQWHGSYMRTFYTGLRKTTVEIHISKADLQASGANVYVDNVGEILTTGATSLLPGNPIVNFLLGLATSKIGRQLVRTFMLNKDGSMDILILQIHGDWAWVYKGKLGHAFPVPISFWPIPVRGLSRLPVPSFTRLYFD